MIIAALGGHHLSANSCTCSIRWRRLTCIRWTGPWITCNNNAFPRRIDGHRETRFSWRRHHFGCNFMASAPSVSQPLTQVAHSVHNRGRNINPFWHHHANPILDHCAHVRTTSVSRRHVHRRAYRRTHHISSGIKCLRRNAHVRHNWPARFAESLKCCAHVAAAFHGRGKGLHPCIHGPRKPLRVCQRCIYNFLRHWGNKTWKHCHFFILLCQSDYTNKI